MRAGNRLDLDDALRGRRCPCPASGQHPCSRRDALAFLKVGGIAPDEQDFLSAAEPRHAKLGCGEGHLTATVFARA